MKNSLSLLLLLFTLCSASNAAVIIPVGIEGHHQGDTTTGDGSILRAIDGSGLTKPDANDPSTWTHSNAWQDDWQGFNANFSDPTANFVVLDLGSPTANLDMMYLWNVNEGNHTGRGMRDFEIFHATSPTVLPGATGGTNQTYDFGSGGWTELGSGFSLAQASGSAGQGPEAFDVSGAAGARYIGFRINSYYANDSNRVGFAEVAFTTAIPTGAPNVATLPATGVSFGGARIRGDLTDAGTGTPAVSLYWGTNDGGPAAAGWASVENLGNQASPGEFFADLTGLSPATTYFFRAYAANAQGEDWASTSETFTTPAALPSVENLAASEILGTEAKLGGTVTNTGGEVPTLVIHYGNNDAGTGAWDSQLDLGEQSESEDGTVSGLSPGTTYFYRASATNSAGTAWAASSGSFVTATVNIPSVTNSPATGVNGTFATLNGEVTDAGGDPPTVTVFYGTTDGGTTAGNWEASISAGTQSGTFSRLASNLTPETTYYFRAFAENIAGQAWAPASQSFTTPVFVPPSVVINEIHYDEDTKTVRAEFIELFNPSDDPVDLSGYYFSSGIDFIFPGGTVLAAGAYLIVAEDPATMVSRFGYNGAFGPFANGTNLRNSGETLTLRDAGGNVVDEVDYQLGFPWPTVGDDIGTLLVSPSIELIHPLLDNSIGGSWRASGFPVATVDTGGGGSPVNYIPGNAEWEYLDDGSDQGTAWRASAFDDSAWSSGPAELGYGDGDETTTINGGPSGSRYATTYFRKSVDIPDPLSFVGFTVSITYDDSYAIYVNGSEVARHSGLAANAAFDDYSSNTVGDNANDTFTVPSSAFSSGTNVVAVEIHQTGGGSSDVSFALSLTGEVDGGTPGGSYAPTPGTANRSYSVSAPPQIRQVDHAPKEPVSNVPVVVTAKITDPDGVASVSLQYQIVEPGDYFCRYLKFNGNGTANLDPRYEDPSEWTSVPMTDDGTGGDELAADSIFTATLPASLQTNRRLIRYRIFAEDAPGTGITVPYSDDPQPNFAWFVYDGTPDWSGVIRPGDTPVTYPGSLMSSIATYFLLSTNGWVDDSQFGGYGGSEYLWPGTLVYDGKVYDHIQYRPRGGVHRYQYGKNFWKFDFKRGHRFQARDNYGRKYKTEWNKLNFSSIVQQVGFNHRGEQGLFESVGFRLFSLAGVESCNTHYTQFYVIDNADPAGANQYEGDYYGLFLAIEQMDGQYLDEHGLPDGNLYKIEGHSGDSNNQGPTQPDDRSDVSTFISAYRNGTPTAQWWSDNLDIEKYLSYRTVVEGIHHYDIAYGKNYFYYHNPETGLFEVHPWDLDLTWANNMYGNGNHDFKSKVAENPAFNTGYQNRVREIMDLLYNNDEGHRLIDETAGHVWTPGQPSLVGADRRLWDNNPRINTADRYYDVAADNEFSGMIQVLKNYIVSRGNWMESNLLTNESDIPDTPVINYTGIAGYPANDLAFSTTSYSSPGSTAFAAMEWRLSEVYNPDVPNYVAGEPYLYEIEDPFESGSLTSFSATYTFPVAEVRPGLTYRVRVRHQDAAGRWSHWSAPVQFTASEPDVTLYQQALVISEIMFNPPAPAGAETAVSLENDDFEFIELTNVSANPVDLTGVRFTKGIDFDFADETMLAAGQSILVVKNIAAFEARYGTGLPVAGSYGTDNLSNGGENIKLSLGAGTAIREFTYDDEAPWPGATDGDGYSLTLIDPDSLPDHSVAANWQISSTANGTPGSGDALNYATWAATNSVTGSETEDDDNDGLSNLLEFALASPPLSPGVESLPLSSVQNGYLTLEFTRPVAADGLSYTVEFSDDLDQWSDASAVFVSSVPNGDGTVTETWRYVELHQEDERRFARLRITM